jgi:hypothetical protein
MKKGALIGFANVTLPWGFEIDDVPVLLSGGKAWASLPARPVIIDGRAAFVPGKPGKQQYVSILRWSTRELTDGFSEKVVALVRARDPGAFNDGSA